ncbi:MAG: tetratricopeptide repeat protein [Pirellulaceae bacterium]|nr:tetratricopeptide repeat protein [Pirellulaceae bacterium]
MILASLLLVSGWRTPLLLAGGGPENVAVVVNADSFASLAVANAFVAGRKIPSGNLIYLPLGDLPDFETVDVATFRQRILRPALETLDARGLAPQIDCLVYSADIPYAVRVAGDLGDRKLPQVLTPTASVNGLTYLYALALAEQPEYMNLGINFYARLPLRVPVADTQAWTDDQREQYQQAVKLLNDKQYAEALEMFGALVEAHPRAAHLWYNRACALARLDRLDEAIEALKRAVENGWNDARHARADEDLAALNGREDFLELLKRLDAQSTRLRPTLGFRSAIGWSPEGQPVPPDAGMRYLLSTMLSVTSGRGLSVSEAIANLERSAKANSTFPEGTIYLMENGDIRSRTRQPMFAETTAMLQALGVRAEVVQGTLPKDRSDVMGLVAGSATFDWPGSGSSILPGAICEHLTSTGGVMVERGGQTPLSEFLRHGAAGASGTVTEPYAIAAKFPLPFLHAHYAQGCSLAEAFYQSVAGPYQLLIVGDPLCAPWARRPTVHVPELAQPLRGTIQFTPTADAPEGKAIGRFDLFVDGVRRAVCRAGDTLGLDTSLLPDGPHELRLVAVVEDAIQTQAHAIWQANIDNHGRRLELKATGGDAATVGQRIALRAAMDGATAIELIHQGRLLERIEAPQGEFTVDTAVLGLGTARLTAIARSESDGPVAAVSAPVTVQVERPKALSPVVIPDGAKLVPGVLVAAADRAPRIVEETHAPQWLEQLDVKPDEPVSIEGYVQIQTEDLMQFQWRCGRTVTLTVNGTEIAANSDERWKFVPVVLSPGTHHVLVRISGDGPPRIDLRFGGPGTYRIGAKQFRAAAPPEE